MRNTHIFPAFQAADVTGSDVTDLVTGSDADVEDLMLKLLVATPGNGCRQKMRADTGTSVTSPLSGPANLIPSAWRAIQL
ncbi:hypothetical protein HPB48_022200 [Haemaphysalis longicornis]|uniref:Uncharacterized protein n=1 Tax=Haemaphysalis longicornis TaxID=44386 RepID=A0A9J6FM65_HAELO|nr:hypothetical protein HPB48_022200 [Haemaphysalis longicornis]